MQIMTYTNYAKYILSIIIVLFIGLLGEGLLAGNKAHALPNDEQQGVKIIKIETEIESHGDENNEAQSRIEVKVSDAQDQVRVFTFDGDALDDLAQLEFELSGLDKETQQTVIDVLKQVKNQDFHPHLDEASENIEQVFILENEHGVATVDAVQVLTESGELHGDVVKIIRNTSASSITKMLEQGNFTPEQLDEIQRALDSKR